MDSIRELPKISYNFITNGFSEFVKILDKIKADPPAFSHLLNLSSHLVHGIRDYSKNTNLLHPLMGRVTTVLNVFSVASLFSDIDDLVNGGKGRSIWNTASKGLFVAADFLSIGMWLESLNLLKIEEASASMGKVSISSVAFGTVTNGVVAAAFGFMAVDACIKISQVNQVIGKSNLDAKLLESAKCARKKAILELAWSVSEIAAKVFAFAAVMTSISFGGIGLLALSVFAASLGLASFIFSHAHEKDLKVFQELSKGVAA